MLGQDPFHPQFLKIRKVISEPYPPSNDNASPTPNATPQPQAQQQATPPVQQQQQQQQQSATPQSGYPSQAPAGAPQQYFAQPNAQQVAQYNQGQQVAPAGAHPQNQQVNVASVANAVTEYVDIPNLGVVKLASMTQRALARILDTVIAVLAGGLLTFIVIAIMTAGAASGSSEGIGIAIVLFLILIPIVTFIALAYETCMVAFFGATLGKMLMKIKVVKSTTGQAPGLLSAAVRYLVPGFVALIPVIGSLGSLLCWISPAFDNSGRHQGWHDKVANTLVVSSAGQPSK